MKNNITELVFILDRSGSMSGFEADTIGGFNSTIENQKEQEGKVFVSTVLFDNYSEVIHDRVDISEIKPMTRNDYQVRGCTALLDAIGGAIHHIGNIHKYARPEDVPEHTIFIITTDGMENEATTIQVRRSRQKLNDRQRNTVGSLSFLRLTLMPLKLPRTLAFAVNMPRITVKPRKELAGVIMQ